MAYTTTAELQKYVQGITFGVSSQPTSSEIGDIIDQVSNEMDVRMQSHGIGVPVTTPTNVMDYLERIAIAGVTARIYDAIDLEPERAVAKLEEFNAELGRIEETPSIIRATSSQQQAPGYNDSSAAERTVRVKRHTDTW